MKMSYEKSVELALAKGFEEIQDENAYKGAYFVRNGLTWIHNIDGLMNQLGINSTGELRQLNYDVDAYENYKSHSNEMVDDELKSLYSDLSPGTGQPAYLMDGMYLFPDGSMGKL